MMKNRWRFGFRLVWLWAIEMQSKKIGALFGQKKKLQDGISKLAQPMWRFFDASQRRIDSTTVPRDYLVQTMA